MHLSHLDFTIIYQPGAKNFLVDDLLRIHGSTPGALDIGLKDSTIVNDSLKLPDPTQPLQINTSYPSTTDFNLDSDDTRRGRSPDLSDPYQQRFSQFLPP